MVNMRQYQNQLQQFQNEQINLPTGVLILAGQQQLPQNQAQSASHPNLNQMKRSSPSQPQLQVDLGKIGPPQVEIGIIPHIVGNENGRIHKNSLSAMTLASLPPDNKNNDHNGQKERQTKQITILEEEESEESSDDDDMIYTKGDDDCNVTNGGTTTGNGHGDI